MPVDLVTKYDGIAEGFAENSYANLSFDMHRRFRIATGWGTPLQAGDSVLELGCGDGYLAELFVQHGLRYRGVDISPRMVEVAVHRLRAAGLEADFVAADVSQVLLSEPVDALLSYMGSFFFYIGDPLGVLKRLKPYVRKKVILDLNPRQINTQTAIEVLRQAGFTNMAWRPFFIPKEKKLPAGILDMLVACENIPLLRNVPLRWKFNVLLKGEAS